MRITPLGIPGVCLAKPVFAVTLSTQVARATLTHSQTVTMTASVAVTERSPASVKWAISPSIGTKAWTGGIAKYTAPSILASSQTVTITATSMADTTKKSSTILRLVPLVTSLLVNPASFAIPGGDWQQLSATDTDANTQADAWSLHPQLVALSATGLETAP